MTDIAATPENSAMATIDPVAAAPSSGSVDTPIAAVEQPPHVIANKPRPRWRAPAWILLVAGAAAAVWVSLGLLSTPATQAAVVAAPVPTATADAVRALISGLGLADSLDVLGDQPDALKVVGVVEGDTQRDALRERLSALKPAPMSNVLTRLEFKTELDAMSKSLDPGLKLAINGRAGVLLSGVVNDAREVDAVAQRVAVELPAAIRVEKAIKTTAEVVAEFSDQLIRQGLAMRARLDGGQMIVDGTLARDRVAQWELLIMDFHKRYGERIGFVASFNEDSPVAVAAAAAGPASNKAWLPPIASVVGGDAPYLVMADGRKVMLGGTLNGYELVAIRSDALVLRAGQGAMREVRR